MEIILTGQALPYQNRDDFNQTAIATPKRGDFKRTPNATPKWGDFNRTAIVTPKWGDFNQTTIVTPKWGDFNRTTIVTPKWGDFNRTAIATPKWGDFNQTTIVTPKWVSTPEYPLGCPDGVLSIHWVVQMELIMSGFSLSSVVLLRKPKKLKNATARNVVRVCIVTDRVSSTPALPGALTVCPGASGSVVCLGHGSQSLLTVAGGRGYVTGQELWGFNRNWTSVLLANDV
ncbi:hypothetical protein J6590_080631 [Homalodisca vitripennis]|nr:hypothetical protein J6590_080631 [Homalodisca vitripennis]